MADDIETPRQLPAWALPSELAVLEGWPSRRRTVRDWLADLGLFAFSGVFWAYGYADAVLDPDPGYLEVVPDWMIAVDPWVGAAACLALWFRRRFPLALAIAMVVAMAVSSTAYGAVLVAILTVAIHRGWMPASLVTAAVAAQSALFSLVWQPPDMSRTSFLVTALLLVAAPLSWGLVVRFRRQLITSLRRDAQRQREEHGRRLQETRRLERQRIAWEMHDVLAHRISLLSVHAGALAFRTAEANRSRPPTREEISSAVQVIRDNAHQALDELGEVLSVLRADDAGEVRAALPLLRDLPQLIEEARAAGQEVTYAVDLDSSDQPRPQEQRTVYRVVQEGLTNARKHAPGMPTCVRLSGRPGDGLSAEVVNRSSDGATTPPAPGSGTGLAGLRERVELDGGTLEHGRVDGEFRLAARLPWPR